MTLGVLVMLERMLKHPNEVENPADLEALKGQPEIIKSIEFEKEGNEYRGGLYIKTNKQNISIDIGTDQTCSEDNGYFISHDEDSINDFIGSVLIDIRRVDEMMNVKSIKEGLSKFDDDGSGVLYFDAGGCVFVNIETNKGTFQIALYNAHNGYYGHYVAIKSYQLNEEIEI